MVSMENAFYMDKINKIHGVHLQMRIVHIYGDGITVEAKSVYVCLCPLRSFQQSAFRNVLKSVSPYVEAMVIVAYIDVVFVILSLINSK